MEDARWRRPCCGPVGFPTPRGTGTGRQPLLRLFSGVPGLGRTFRQWRSFAAALSTGLHRDLPRAEAVLPGSHLAGCTVFGPRVRV